MIDIFLQKDLRALFKEKTIVFMGDSNTRALYKDFLCLMHESYMISQSKLKAKMEKSIFNDKLTFHGEKNNGRGYREERQSNSSLINASFYFITRVYDDYVKSVLNRITAYKDPDVLIINSCLWDLTRWGASGVKDFKSNLTLLMRHLQQILPNCLVIWVTSPPLSSEVRGGFLVPDLQFLKYSLRFHVVEANHYAREVVVEHGFDVVDSHYHLKSQIHRREVDGIHWSPHAVRYVLNLLLTHISLAWSVPLPHRYNSSVMKEYLERLEDELSMVEPKEVKVQVPESTQQKPKANKKKRRKKPTPQKKLVRGKSHHAYTTRNKQNERLQRIRRWQASVPSTYTSDSQYNSPANSQHDSGYFPSPSTEAYLSNDSVYSQRNITFASPQFSQSYNSHLSVGREVHQWQVQTETYYPATVQDYPATVQALSNSSYAHSSRYFYENGQSLLGVPYSFPHVAQNQVLCPRIDFTADDFAVSSV